MYPSAFLTEDQAECALRRHLGVGENDPRARHLKMNVGRVERSWVKSFLAVSLSQGFIEPLEATALHIVQATVEGYLDALDNDAPLSWHCLMAGYSAVPDNTKMPEADLPLANMAKIDRFVGGYASNFPSHEIALAALRPKR